MSDKAIWAGWPLSTTGVKTDVHGHKKREQNRRKQLMRAERDLLDQLDQLLPGSRTGLPDLSFTQDLLLTLEQWQSREADQTRHIKKLRSFLRRGLLNGQQALNWSVVLPPQIITLPAISNPLTPQAISTLPIFRKQLELFLATLQPTWCGSAREQVAIKLYWGRFFFSSVTLGGLLDSAALLQLPFCQDKVKRWQEQVWFELFTNDMPEYVQVKRAPRHWFPDPVSLILFKQLPPLPVERCHDRDSSRRWVYGCLQDFLAYLNNTAGAHSLARHQLHDNIQQWLCDATTYWQLILPPFLIEHSRGQSGATAWTTSCWQRVLEKKSPPLTESVEPTLAKTVIPISANVSRNPTDAQIQQLYKDIKKTLHRPTNQPAPSWKIIHDQLRSLRDESLKTSIVIGGLLDWILSRYSQKEIKRSTAYQELTSLGRSLLAELDEAMLTDMEAADFEAVYEAILEQVTNPHTRSQKAKQLRRYHLHMVQLAGWPSLYFSLEGQNESPQADAHILLEEEYQCLYSALLGAKDDPYRHMQLILLILGFRCGLRISEARGLRLEDVHYRGTLAIIDSTTCELGRLHATLLVRRNPFSSLKTDNAKRQLPLGLLLANHELAELLDYHQQQRRRSGIQRGCYLFADMATNTRPVDLERVQPALHYLMRQVTGDHKMRYHHLRHSFATHLVQLFTGQDTPLTLPTHWLASTNTDSSLPRLVAHISPQSELSRKGLFAIAEWIGHASPGTTLCHYVHNLDHLLKNQMWAHSFAHQRNGLGFARQFVAHIEPARYVADLLGISDENVRQRNSRYGHLMGWVPALLGLQDQSRDSGKKQWHRPDQVDLQMMDVHSAPRSLENFDFDEWCSFLSLWRQGVAVSELAKIFYLSPDSLPPQLAKLQKLFERKGKKGGKTLVRQQPTSFGQLRHLPVVPRSRKELESAQRYYLSIQRLLMSENTSEYLEGLRYFATQYRTWNNRIRWEELDDKPRRHDGLKHLISKLAPHIQLPTSPAGVQYRRSAGQISLTNPQTGKSSHGLYFALLVACISQTVKV
ncbi:MAG: tyrosine-type recombinase/integrase [Vogesella sp.]|uniref:tyrosine-type recombinase/integrase n=1 Tax=Vogesella sp. TaxID=1904252 RepID=UPI00391B1C8E